MIGLAGRTAVVTGASAGVGKAIARKLVEGGWRVIGVGRDAARCASAEAEIATASAESFTMLRGDFSLMEDVRRVAAEIGGLTDRLDVLVNNAGGVRDRRIVTTEGLEATFAANHLAAFLLTHELLPMLRANAAARPRGAVRVIAVSSSGHRVIPGLDWSDLQSLKDFAPTTAYCRAKLANILFTRELARRVGPDGIVPQAMHPGVVASNFAAHGDATLQAHMTTVDTVSPDEPADTLVWLACSAEAGHDPGRFFYRMAEETPADPALDADAARRLWRESEALLAGLGHL
jgi:NAD(P)-dependent dehydrogenase (short-subunit alcohol dehydrogenase family)